MTLAVFVVIVALMLVAAFVAMVLAMCCAARRGDEMGERHGDDGHA